MMETLELANEWLRLDKDPATRTEIQNLVQAQNIEELERRLRARITFGTAGLRGRVEAGFARINSLTTIQTSQGLAQHLLKTKIGAREAGVVVGYDARRDSRRFALLAAAAFKIKGFKVIWFDDYVHTPLVPFGVQVRGAAAGIMITASHNPKEDNGYKVYGSNACQINTPEDEAIQRSIMLNLEPETWDPPQLTDERGPVSLEYFQSIAQMGVMHTMPRFSYTPMHGVGLSYLEGALNEILKPSETSSRDFLCVVPAQADPDPEFPTVDYPNPEEAGALDLAIANADVHNISLIIANDPDADRLAVAEKIESGWYLFTGDQIGAVLAYYVSEVFRTDPNEPCVMITSAVSSQMLAAIGEAEGFAVEETLTGFKWIGNRALQIGKSAIFGYEEALGYMVSDIVHDKDGIAATILLLQACSKWNKLPHAVLSSLWEKYGYFASANTYWKSPNLVTTRTIFDTICSNPMLLATSLGPGVACRIRDLSRGTDTATLDGKAALPLVPGNLMITMWLTGHPQLCDGVRCTIRASGTEPKVKVYIECRSSDSFDAGKTAALEVLGLVARIWFQHPQLQMENNWKLKGNRGACSELS